MKKRVLDEDDPKVPKYRKIDESKNEINFFNYSFKT